MTDAVKRAEQAYREACGALSELYARRKELKERLKTKRSCYLCWLARPTVARVMRLGSCATGSSCSSCGGVGRSSSRVGDRLTSEAVTR